MELVCLLKTELHKITYLAENDTSSSEDSSSEDSDGFEDPINEIEGIHLYLFHLPIEPPRCMYHISIILYI